MIQPHPKFTSFTTDEFDFGNKLGVGLTFEAGNYRYRNAVALNLNLTNEQQVTFLVTLAKAELTRKFWRKLGAM